MIYSCQDNVERIEVRPISYWQYWRGVYNISHSYSFTFENILMTWVAIVGNSSSSDALQLSSATSQWLENMWVEGIVTWTQNVLVQNLTIYSLPDKLKAVTALKIAACRSFYEVSQLFLSYPEHWDAEMGEWARGAFEAAFEDSYNKIYTLVLQESRLRGNPGNSPLRSFLNLIREVDNFWKWRNGYSLTSNSSIAADRSLYQEYGLMNEHGLTCLGMILLSIVDAWI